MHHHAGIKEYLRRQVFHQMLLNNFDQLEERGEAPANGVTMTMMAAGTKRLDMRGNKKRSDKIPNDGAIVEAQAVIGMMEVDLLVLTTMVGMMRMILVDTTHLTPTHTMESRHQEIKREVIEEITIEELENVVEVVEEEGAKEEVGEEEGLMRVKEGEVAAIPSQAVQLRSTLSYLRMQDTNIYME